MYKGRGHTPAQQNQLARIRRMASDIADAKEELELDYLALIREVADAKKNGVRIMDIRDAANIGHATIYRVPKRRQLTADEVYIQIRIKNLHGPNREQP